MTHVEITAEIFDSNPVLNEPWVENAGVYWFTYDGLGVRELAKAMKAIQARFVTITAYELPKNEGFRLEYHWDVAGRLLGFTFNLAGNSIESIYDLCEAVDWIEREVQEEYGIEFTGREYEPLLLRQGDAPGVNLREVTASTPAAQEVAK
jgi:hypothetical protein